MRLASHLTLLGCALWVFSAPAQARAEKPAYTTWADYGGAADSMQYSALAQVNKTNVKQLELAWSWPVPGPSGRFGFNPVVVDNVMYVLGESNCIVALNAVTGKQIWSHHVAGGSPGNRGINYWEGKDRKDRRLIYGVGNNLREINALTGESVTTFGSNGQVNMRVGEPRALGGPSLTPGRVFENLFITGSSTGESWGAPPGDIRAYDIITGELVWRFRTVPLPGDYGYDTWPPEAWKYAGGVNCWGEISIDEKRGIAYVPTGSSTYDFYGGDRIGADLFANCLLALDARTGKRLWHFQAVHHDLWDYDLTTAPKLLTVQHDGHPVDIVAEPTKFGFVYVFNRVTGEPLWPIEERPVPRSDVPGETAWPTQPFPTKPPPFARQQFTTNDINPYTDVADQERLRQILLKARNEGLFTPPAMRNTIDLPGELGGCNWGGAAADPPTGALYVRSHNSPTMHILTARPRIRNIEGGTPEQRGRAVYGQTCLPCHGEPEAERIRTFDKTGWIPIKELGPERIATQIRQGKGQMPPFSESLLSATNLQALLAYLDHPTGPAANAGQEGGDDPHVISAPDQLRFQTPYGTLNTSNGLPAIGPPWAELTAYDLNQGTILWRVPLGTVLALKAKGIPDTGSYHPTRNGLVATAGGLIFIGTWSDQTVRAFDKDTGQVLWERRLESNPEGIPAVYEVDGRQYVAFCTREGNVFDNIGATSIAWEKGKPEAQGYYVFALPEKASAPTR
jgi:quinoprotein glucose dehydrogenase